MADEEILCLERTRVPSSFLPRCGAVALAEEEAGRLLDGCGRRFIRRSEAETSPAYKQCIPYLLLRRDGRFAAYPRGELASALSVAVQDRCDLLQTEVAGRMAEQIVVFLEVIHIDHQQAQLRALPASTKQLLLERAIKIAPVEEAG